MSTATAVREHPILFSGPMVRAILDGRKTQTRRVVKAKTANVKAILRHGSEWMVVDDTPHRSENREWICCPYGQPGDRLWVRETWAQGISYTPANRRIAYRATEPDLDATWKPSIHMKRAHSRLSLEITEVRVQRLNEINEADAIAEGIYQDAKPPIGHCGNRYFRIHEGATGGWLCAPDAYQDLWDSLNNSRGYGWDANPWVWAISFRRTT